MVERPFMKRGAPADSTRVEATERRDERLAGVAREPRSVKLPLVAGLSMAVVAIVASFLGIIGGIGNPQPGQLRDAELTCCAIAAVVIAGIVLASVGLSVRLPPMPIVVALIVAGVGAYLVSPFPTGNGLPRSDAGFVLLAATPIVALLVARRDPRRSAAFVSAAAIGSLAYLAECVIGALRYL